MTIDLDKELQRIQERYRKETEEFVRPELAFVADTMKGGEDLTEASGEQLKNSGILERLDEEDKKIQQIRHRIDRII